MSRQETGALGEQCAGEYLTNHGYRILERNWRSGRWGELDIVALDGETTVVVEVRTREPAAPVTPQESVTPHKIQVLKRTAQLFLKMHPELPPALRIDLVTVEFSHPEWPDVRLYRNISSG